MKGNPLEKNKFSPKENETKKKSSLYKYLKRFLDITVSLVAIILLIPIFIITSIAICLESSGPIIFKQKRVGKNGKLFYIYKFRSMKINTPNVPTEEFKNAKDYTTKVGEFIRKTSIDELPQLINVLKGEMSLIGPRPVIEKEINLIQLRHLYKVDTLLPGITGWAQINGRDNISYEEKAEYDYEYLINQSFTLDMKIIIMTAIKLIKSEDIKM